MGLETHAARRVGHDVHLVAIAERVDHRHREADLGPQRRHHDFLPAGLLDPFDDASVFPRVDEGAVDGLLLGKDVLELLEQIAAAVLDYGRQKRRYAEDLRGFGKTHDVVDHALRIVAAQTGELERLVIDQDQDAVVGRQQCIEPRFRIRVAHRSSFHVPQGGINLAAVLGQIFKWGKLARGNASRPALRLGLGPE